jgi:hypothetical protein
VPADQLRDALTQPLPQGFQGLLQPLQPHQQEAARGLGDPV